jgi:uncharacterized protein (TIGR03083 family)
MVRTRATPGEAFVEQGWAVHDWLTELEPEAFARPTVLPGWDAHVLLAHVDQMVEGLVTVLQRPTREAPLGLDVVVGRYAEAAEQMSRRVLDHAAAYEPATLLDRLADGLDRAGAVLGSSALAAAAVASARGPVTPADLVAGRVVEVVVHADDLSRTFAERDPVPLLRPALGVASRALANILATRYPGRSVEVRIPPYAAVQCSAVRDGVLDPGPTHTRGTPPNVVETDAVTFFRLCTGRTSWPDALASGVVAASGLRADLSEMVPLLA